MPSLIAQIEEYAAGRAVDEALRLTRKPADSLTESDCLHMLDNFFVGYAPKVVDVFPRYRELMELRNPRGRTAAQALPDFPAAALRDLQVWATLAWFHPLVVARDPALQELRRKGRDFAETDKETMLQRQDEVLRGVLPLHRQMAESGQIELSTTPFYHPILPLLRQPGVRARGDARPADARACAPTSRRTPRCRCSARSSSPRARSAASPAACGRPKAP